MLKPGTLRRVGNYYLTQKETADSIMPRAIKEFFNCKTDVQYEEALRSLSDDIYAHGQFNEWLIFDFIMDNDKSMIANFLNDNGRGLSAAERNLYKKLLETNHYSLYEVLDVKRGVGLSLCDMHTGKKYEVSEYSATFDLNVGNIFYARLAQVDDRYEMVSADSKVMDVRFSERFRYMMRQTEKSNKKKKHLMPKDTYNFTLDDSSNTANPVVDPVLAEKRLQDFLEKQGMTKHISVEKICAWIQQEKDPLGSSHIVSIICGLTRNTLDKSDIDELMTVVSDLWNSHPHESLAGRSPQDMKMERVYHNEHEAQTDFVADITPLGGSKCWDAADKATKLLKSGKYCKALEKYQETFRLMLEEKATILDIYRIYANKGLAHLLIGQEIEGVRMLEMATELNPNYTFAKEQLDHYRSGEMADDIQAGFLEAARDRFEDPDSPLRKWNPNSVEKRYLTDEIFELLRSNGIILDESSFKALLQKYVDISDLVDKELYPKYTGEEKDEDMVWATATVLASRLAPDAFHVDGLIDAILKAEELIIDKGLLNSKKSLWHLATFIRYARSAPTKLFTKWQTYSDYPRQASLIIEVALVYIGTSKGTEVIDMCDGFNEKTGDVTFMIPKIYALIAQEDHEWTMWYKKLKDNLPYDPYAEVVISRAFGDSGDHENTEKHVRLAVISAEKGIKERVRRSRSGKDIKRALAEREQSYTDLEYALDNLKNFLNRHKKKDEAKIVGKRLSETRSMREDIAQKRIKALQESVERETIEMAKKSLSADPAVVYFNYVREIGIDYSTAEQVGINISSKSPTGEKIGRNDPCPCGSNKKFKKCHGK